MTWCLTEGRRRRLYAIAALAVATVHAGCEFPTEAPIFESRYVVPAADTTLAVAALLPAGMTDLGGAFEVALPEALFDGYLYGLCSACVPLAGLGPVPWPGFTGVLTDSVSLPAGVSSVMLSDGLLEVRIRNLLGFDVLMPPGAVSVGSIRFQALSGSTQLADTTITGPFPTSTARSALLRLQPGTATGRIDIRVTITSPAGGTEPEHFVLMSQNLVFEGRVTATGVTASAADVAVNDVNVAIADVDLDLSDVDETLAERTQSGAMIVKVTNPFNVSGDFTLRITGGTAGDIVKPLPIPAGGPGTPVSTQSVPFTGAELQSILGQDVNMSITGTVDAVTPFVTVMPGQAVTFETLLDLVVRMGGDDE